ncbi:hypothetical protein AWZ03_008154 [Drosophila navojoa]|uniref:Uncharacterized protein n=1 Tax=Drosophila navojoa TaxID=7232 RepID=A0A484B9J8_DRONA|nr:hypothetical protein AWZ03_008154 [Drosophila navojoa]
MALKQVDFKGNKEINLLKPCWIAGNNKYSTARFVKHFARHEINEIDVVASCEKIHDIIETNQVRRGTLNNVVDTLSCRAVTFKDIARLTFGINYILNQQVTSLLDDTKHLLDQIIGNKFDLNQPTQKRNPDFNCRKRKQIITKHTTTVCVAKRARIREPQLLDEENVDYYRHLLTESQQWNIEKENVAIEQSQTIEVARSCLPEHMISVTHELTFTEMEQEPMWNNGFGDSNQVDVTALEEFLPARNAVKRKSLDHCPTGVLSCKMPRLETDTIMKQTNNNPETYNPCQEVEQEMVQLELPPPIVITPQKLNFFQIV